MALKGFIKEIIVVSTIGMSGVILIGIQYLRDATNTSHLSWCHMLEGGSATYMYGTLCPTQYVSQNRVDDALVSLQGTRQDFWLCMIVVLAILAIHGLILARWLKDAYGQTVLYGLRQCRYDPKFVAIMESNFTAEEIAFLSGQGKIAE